MIDNKYKRKAVNHKYPKITVSWGDHFIHYGDFELEDVLEAVKRPLYGEYTGYLIAESKQVLCIASNIWEDGSISDPMYIMKRVIKERVMDEG